ncbi:MAG: DUF4105 domain-containing protein [Methylococcaceae bacterium]
MHTRHFLLLLMVLLVFQPKAKAQALSPQATVSILTCDPGKEVYSMYGHSAIRVSDPLQRLDAVFNYGLFSFDSPNFIYRFAKGQTDYLMGGQTFSSFLPEYEQDRRSVYEQVLNLSAEGKDKLYNALMENARPENRMYRYNYFMDNCATRVRDMIERNAGGTVHFSESHPKESYRDLIKKFHHSFRWIDFGIDLLISKPADQPVSSYGQMFLPEYLFNQFANAQIETNGTTQPLVKETRTLVEYPNHKMESDLPWPAIVFGLLFLLVAYISFRNYRKNKRTDWLDYWLLTLTGLSGMIMSWFALYSEHPAMSPNYNILWAMPLNLLFVFIWRVKKWRSTTHYYFYLMGALLLLSMVMGQVFNPAVYFIILMLLVRVIVNLLPARA